MVYTTEDTMDEVGLLLIHKVRTTIRYKTEDATHAGVNWRIYNFDLVALFRV